MIKVGNMSADFIRIPCGAHCFATAWTHAKVLNAASRKELAKELAAKAAAAAGVGAAARAAAANPGLNHPLLAGGAALNAAQVAGAPAGGGGGAPALAALPAPKLTSLGLLMQRLSVLTRLAAGGTYAYQTFRALMAQVEKEESISFGRIKGPLPFYAAKWGYEHAAAKRLILLRPVIQKINCFDPSYSMVSSKREIFSKLKARVLERDLPNYKEVAPVLERMGLWATLLTAHRRPTSPLALLAVEDIDSMLTYGERLFPKAAKPAQRELLDDIAKGWASVHLLRDLHLQDHMAWAAALDPTVAPFLRRPSSDNKDVPFAAHALDGLELFCKNSMTGWFAKAHVELPAAAPRHVANPWAAAAPRAGGEDGGLAAWRAGTRVGQAFEAYRRQVATIYGRAFVGERATASTAAVQPDPGLMSCVNPLEWWRQKAAEQPVLDVLLHGPVADLLSRPATSVSSEGAFSVTRAMIPYARCSTSAATLREEVLTSLRCRPEQPVSSMCIPVPFAVLNDDYKKALWSGAQLDPKGLPVLPRVAAAGGGGAAEAAAPAGDGEDADEGDGAAAAAAAAPPKDAGAVEAAADDGQDDDDGPPPLIDQAFDEGWAAAAEEVAQLREIDPGDRGDSHEKTLSDIVFEDALGELSDGLFE
jgi:hypothetical protein